jgi:hypothetical protein
MDPSTIDHLRYVALASQGNGNSTEKTLAGCLLHALDCIEKLEVQRRETEELVAHLRAELAVSRRRSGITLASRVEL